VFKEISKRRFIRKSRQTLKDVYRFASIIYGPKRLYSIKNFDPEKRYGHRAYVNAFKRGKRQALLE
jgi:hypothetical protein